MKKVLILGVLLLALGAALAAPGLSEKAARVENLPDVAGELRSQLGEKGEQLREFFASHESGEIAEHFRTIFQRSEELTDEELDAEIRAAAEGVSLSLSDEQAAQLRELFRKYEHTDGDGLRQALEDWKEKLSLDSGRLDGVKDTLQEAGEVLQDAAQEAGKLWDPSKDILTNLRDIFQGFVGTEKDITLSVD